MGRAASHLGSGVPAGSQHSHAHCLLGQLQPILDCLLPDLRGGLRRKRNSGARGHQLGGAGGDGLEGGRRRRRRRREER